MMMMIKYHYYHSS